MVQRLPKRQDPTGAHPARHTNAWPMRLAPKYHIYWYFAFWSAVVPVNLKPDPAFDPACLWLCCTSLILTFACIWTFALLLALFAWTSVADLCLLPDHSLPAIYACIWPSVANSACLTTYLVSPTTCRHQPGVYCSTHTCCLASWSTLVPHPAQGRRFRPPYTTMLWKDTVATSVVPESGLYERPPSARQVRDTIYYYMCSNLAGS